MILIIWRLMRATLAVRLDATKNQIEVTALKFIYCI